MVMLHPANDMQSWTIYNTRLLSVWCMIYEIQAQALGVEAIPDCMSSLLATRTCLPGTQMIGTRPPSLLSRCLPW